MQSNNRSYKAVDVGGGRDWTVVSGAEFIPVKNGPSLGFGVHASGQCNGLCAPPNHVEILWCHPQYPLEEVSPEAFTRTFQHWIGLSARLIGRAELPPREDGWLAWAVEVTDAEHKGNRT
jgi:hypothetical protein